ncbi:hypothetical protein DFH09DRAFT_1086767 [Mycena vulgaris]|nr:hypothetical protein DFH09DRAFT_1086767 [Mycena vulgaris]
MNVVTVWPRTLRCIVSGAARPRPSPPVPRIPARFSGRGTYRAARRARVQGLAAVSGAARPSPPHLVPRIPTRFVLSTRSTSRIPHPASPRAAPRTRPPPTPRSDGALAGVRDACSRDHVRSRARARARFRGGKRRRRACACGEVHLRTDRGAFNSTGRVRPHVNRKQRGGRVPRVARSQARVCVRPLCCAVESRATARRSLLHCEAARKTAASAASAIAQTRNVIELAPVLRKVGYGRVCARRIGRGDMGSDGGAVYSSLPSTGNGQAVRDATRMRTESILARARVWARAAGAFARTCLRPWNLIGGHKIVSLLTVMSLSKMKNVPTEDKLSDEALKPWLEEEDSLSHQIDTFLAEALEDFPKDDNVDDAAKYAAEIARAVITDKTRGGHIRFGLPTRSRHVSEFMTGLEKTKTAYLFAWLLLLRLEEVIRLLFERINIIPGARGLLEVQLGTRKFAQTGIGHAWTLHANDIDPKICPVRALIRLAVVYGDTIELAGPLFLKVNKNGAVLQDTPITTSIMSCALTKDLQDLSYKSWKMYGTDSFRRGGCQYRIENKGWTVDMVAAWGGWSQVEAVTMFRYFYSPKDNHEYMAEYDRNVTKRQNCSPDLPFVLSIPFS